MKWKKKRLPVFLRSFQSLDDDCTLEEEDEGLIAEEDEIDQFNDDTFGAGAIGESDVKFPADGVSIVVFSSVILK